MSSYLNIFIGIPCYGNNLTLTTFNSIQKLTKYFYEEKIKFDIHTIGQESLIPRARNFLASMMIASEKNYSHLFFIDADIGFEVQNFKRLLEFNKEITCGVYPVKQLQWKKLQEKIKTSNSIDEKFLKENSITFAVDFDDPTNVKTYNGFAKVRHGATGFMLVKRIVLETIIKKHPEIKYDHTFDNTPQYDFFQTGVLNIDKKSRYLSEDYFFCYLWKKLGGEIWSDLAAPLSHFGSHEFKGSVLGSAQKNK